MTVALHGPLKAVYPSYLIALVTEESLSTTYWAELGSDDSLSCWPDKGAKATVNKTAANMTVKTNDFSSINIHLLPLHHYIHFIEEVALTPCGGARAQPFEGRPNCLIFQKVNIVTKDA
jgi:hypothetical protein